jgi:hypothetical protein
MPESKGMIKRTIEIHEREIELLNRDLHYITSEVTQEVIMSAIKEKEEVLKNLKRSRHFGIGVIQK